MPQPDAVVNIAGGQLGRITPLDDGLAAIIVSGVAIANEITLGVPRLFTSLEEVEQAGIDAAYDTTNSTNAHRQIADFYAEAGNGAKLWVCVLVNTTALTTAVASIDAIVAASESKVRLVMITRQPDGGYTPTIVAGMDDDVPAAIAAAKTKAKTYADQYGAFSVIIEGRNLTDDSAVVDLRATNNEDGSKYVSVVLGDTVSGADTMAGKFLGRLARIPAQRSPGRVRDGAIKGVTTAYIGIQLVTDYTQGELDALHDKGYIFPRKHIGVDGYYWNDGNNADPISSDFAYISRVRVIEKARIVVRSTLLLELLDEVPVDPATGRLAPAYVAELKLKCDNALQAQLLDNLNASDAFTEIDPTQNVLSTDKVEVTVKVVPVGTARTIEATVQYFNPAL